MQREAQKKKRKKKTWLQVSLCNNSQTAPPLTHTHRLLHNTHVSICTPQTPSTHRHHHYPFKQTLSLPPLNFTKPPSHPILHPARYPEQILRPDKVITTYLEKQITGVVPSSQLGRNKNFPNRKRSASVNWIALDAARKRGRMVMIAHSAQLYSLH